MDPFSALANGVAVGQLLLGAIKIGRDCINEIKDGSEEAAALVLRISVVMDRAEALQNLFFRQTPPMINSMNDRMFDHLRYATQRNVNLLVERYYYLVHLRYRSLREFYDLKLPNNNDRPALERRHPLRWFLGGKARFQETAAACEKLNEQLFEIYQTYLQEQLSTFLQAPSSTTPSQLDKLKEDSSIKTLGLDEELDLIRISSRADQTWEDLETKVPEEFDHVFSNGSKMGNHKGRKVFVEFKRFTPGLEDYSDLTNAKASKPTLDRISQLAVLLNRHHSPRSRLLHCRGFYCDPLSFLYGFILESPPDRYFTPYSLEELLMKHEEQRTRKGIKPPVPVECRMRLALAMALALFQFHTVGWLHKSIQSSNIIFFGKSASPIPKEDLHEPWVVGFEFAREEGGFSENPVGNIVDAKRDIYRHPDRWGVPTTRYGKVHDIYSLGVVLLEIGLWRPLKKLEKSEFRTIKYDERYDVQKLFLSQAKEQLPFYMGTAYTAVVEKCISGKFGDDTPGINIVDDLYREQVIGVLRQLAASSIEENL